MLGLTEFNPTTQVSKTAGKCLQGGQLAGAMFMAMHINLVIRSEVGGEELLRHKACAFTIISLTI